MVTFVPTDASHNAESIPDMGPKGTAAFKVSMNKPVAFKVTKSGLYGGKFSMSMVALVQAGKVSSGERAHRQRCPALTIALTLVK